MLGTELSHWHASSHALLVGLEGVHCYFSHFVDKQMEAGREQAVVSAARTGEEPGTGPTQGS